MKNQDLQEEFIRLRDRGISYDNISLQVTVENILTIIAKERAKRV